MRACEKIAASRLKHGGRCYRSFTHLELPVSPDLRPLTSFPSSMSTTTDRRYVCQFGHNEQVSQVFLASDKQLPPNRNGSRYLQLHPSDHSGGIAARLWNASEND